MNFFRIVCKKPEQICVYPPLDSYYPVEKKLHLPGAVKIRQRPMQYFLQVYVYYLTYYSIYIYSGEVTNHNNDATTLVECSARRRSSLRSSVALLLVFDALFSAQAHQ